MKALRRSILLLCILISAPTLAQRCGGKPWNEKPQIIPGKLECEFYDLGGEGVAYHDKDSINNGSGKLNPANGTFVNEFRMREGVDISFTKPAPVDVNPYNLTQPKMNQLYVGWTEPGELINYTIDVKTSGNYGITLMYTASGNGSVSLLLDGSELVNEIIIPSTRNDDETIEWRQWHHWNILKPDLRFRIEEGRHVLTLKTTDHGNMNYDYILFELR